MRRTTSRKASHTKSYKGTLMLSCAALVFVGIIACGYGHAARTTDLLVSGEATVAKSAPVYMQDFTVTDCARMANHEQTILTDRRDSQTYWVEKMADGNCWMVQDLRLELSASKKLTPELTDIETEWSPEFDTDNIVSQNTITTAVTGTRSYNFGKYIVLRNTNTGGYNKQASLSGCSAYTMEVGTRTPSTEPDFWYKTTTGYNDTEYDAHYLIGIYYQRAAATAGSVDGITTGQAQYSICPKGWRLPSGYSSDTTTDYMKLVSSEAMTTSNYFNSPFFFHKSGSVNNSTYFLLRRVGTMATYATRNVASNYAMVFDGTTTTNNISKAESTPVRCIFYGK